MAGKILFIVTINQVGETYSKTYILTAGYLLKADFGALAKKALALAAKDKDSWGGEHPSLYVYKIEYDGSIDG